MKLSFLKSKIHRAKVTNCNSAYEGSLSVDSSLMETAHILPYEKIDVYNITNGERFTTYVIPERPNSGIIQVNGAAAHKARPDDLIIIAAYTWLDESEVKNHRPTLVHVNEKNQAVPDNVGREM